MFWKSKNIGQLISSVFNTEEGRLLIDALYRKEVLKRKDYSNQNVMIAQVAVSDFILELINVAKIPESELATPDPAQQIEEFDTVKLEEDTFFNVNEED